MASNMWPGLRDIAIGVLAKTGLETCMPPNSHQNDNYGNKGQGVVIVCSYA